MWPRSMREIFAMPHPKAFATSVMVRLRQRRMSFLLLPPGGALGRIGAHVRDGGGGPADRGLRHAMTFSELGLDVVSS